MTTNPRYKIVFLVPVFEREDCVEDFVLNIRSFCPNSAILLHVNSKSSNNFYQNICKIVDYYQHCYLFPTRYPSDWCSGHLPRVFVEMMKWCNDFIDFDYVYLTASNSLVVNANIEKDISSYDIFSWEPWPTNDSNGWWPHIKNDLRIFAYTNPIYCCAFEGSAYNKDSSKKMISELHDLLQFDPSPYPAEEYWLPSATLKIIDKYSFNYSKYSMERWVHLKDGLTHDLCLDIDSVEEYVCDFIYRKDYDFLSSIKVYSLKRVPRIYEAPLREIIRGNFNYSNRLF